MTSLPLIHVPSQISTDGWLLQESSRGQEQGPYNCPCWDWSELTSLQASTIHIDCLHGPPFPSSFLPKGNKNLREPNVSHAGAGGSWGAGRDPGNTGSPGHIPCHLRPTVKSSLPAASRTHEGARLSALGCCLQTRQVQNRSTTPTVHLGERKLGQPLPETTSAYRKQVSLLGPRPPPPLFSFFSNGDLCNWKGLSIAEEEEARAAGPPTGYVGQSKNPEKEE